MNIAKKRIIKNKRVTIGKKPPCKSDPIIIRKYSNRRLYDTFHSKYISLSDVRNLVNNSLPFKVIEVKRNEDITKSILSQIIHDSETNGDSVLPIDLLLRLIKVYNSQMDKMCLPNYLNESLKLFSHQRQEFSNQVNDSFDTNNPYKELQKIGNETVQQFMSFAGYNFTDFSDHFAVNNNKKSNLTLKNDKQDSFDYSSSTDDIDKLKKEIVYLKAQLKKADNSVT